LNRGIRLIAEGKCGLDLVQQAEQELRLDRAVIAVEVASSANAGKGCGGVEVGFGEGFGGVGFFLCERHGERLFLDQLFNCCDGSSYGGKSVTIRWRVIY
jgi:hypothetical protein